MKKQLTRRVVVKKGQKYLVLGKRAVPFDNYDKNGLPVIKPLITKTKDKNGKEHVKIKIPALKIKHQTNGKRNIL